MVSYLVFSIFCDTLVIEPTPLKRICQDMDGFDKHAGCSRMSTPDCVLCSGLSGYTATPTLTPNQSLSSDFTERFQDLCHGKGFLNTRFPLPSPPPSFPLSQRPGRQTVDLQAIYFSCMYHSRQSVVPRFIPISASLICCCPTPSW